MILLNMWVQCDHNFTSAKFRIILITVHFLLFFFIKHLSVTYQEWCDEMIWKYSVKYFITVTTKDTFTKLAHEHFTALCSRIFFFLLCTSIRIRCTSSHIRCMRFCCRIKPPQNSEHRHYLDAIECDLDLSYRIISQHSFFNCTKVT